MFPDVPLRINIKYNRINRIFMVNCLINSEMNFSFEIDCTTKKVE